MSDRILMMDIAGCDVALSSSSSGVAQWASSVLPCLRRGSIPPGMSLSIDPATGTSDAGGLSVQTTDISAIMGDVGVSAATTLDGALSASATSVDLVSASGLPSNGKIWVGQECISYLSIVSNTLTSCTRGALGTYATKHSDGARVYTSNPAILKRRVELSWQDALAPSTSTAWSRWVGFIENIGWSEGYYTINIISAAALAMDAKGLATPFIKGSLAADFPGVLKDLYLNHTDDAYPWTEYDSTRGYIHIRLGDEILKVEQVLYPAATDPVASFTANNRFNCSFPSKFFVGQLVDITDSSGNIQAGGQALTIVDIYDDSSGTSYIDVAGDTNGYSYSSGDEIRANYTAVIPHGRIERGAFDTPQQDHGAGAEATEVRVLEGDVISEVLLPLLCSVDGSGTHGPDSGAYDILPAGWGAGLPAAYIDLDALRELQMAGRATQRRYFWTESVQLTDLIAWIAQTTNSSLHWTEQGQISCILRDDLYPGTVLDHSIGTAVLKDKMTPSVEVRTDRLYNAAEVKMDRDPISGESRHTLYVGFDESIERYDRRQLEIRDPGLWRNDAEAQLQMSLLSWLRHRALPYPEVSVPVILQENVTYRPGQLTSITFAHLPNMEGSKGLVDTWEINEVSPSDGQGYIDLRAIYRGALARTGHIAVAGVVASKDSTTQLTLAAASTTKLAQQSAYGGTLPINGDDGTEDVDWFLEGDKIRIWRASTLGGTATTADYTISSIDYATRAITITGTLPVWLVAGDIVRLQDYATFQGAATEADREDIMIALADSSASPPDIDGDSAFVWGMS